jgi:hypothetical protein
VIEFIVAAAREAGETPADFMVDLPVEIGDDGTASAQEFPPP